MDKALLWTLIWISISFAASRGRLMPLLAVEIDGKRVLGLIRAFRGSGVMTGGLAAASEEGVPQGGPPGPILSSVMLDVPDKGLENRGHKLCRHAEGCSICVESMRAGARVYKSTAEFIESKLKLKINLGRSAAGKPAKRKLPGFSSCFRQGAVKMRIHPKSAVRFKEKVKPFTSRLLGAAPFRNWGAGQKPGWMNFCNQSDALKH
jgi:RNA-directed DNA polymerase